MFLRVGVREGWFPSGRFLGKEQPQQQVHNKDVADKRSALGPEYLMSDGLYEPQHK